VEVEFCFTPKNLQLESNTMTTVYLYESTIDKIHPVVINPTAPLKALKNLLRTNLKVFWAGNKLANIPNIPPINCKLFKNAIGISIT
jgi:hypothetical protein